MLMFCWRQQSGVEHYRNRLTSASDYIRQALDLLPDAQYGQQMEARIYYHVSAIYREKRKYGRAKYWVKRSKQLLEGVEPGEDTAKTFYNEARLYMKILASSPRNEQCRCLAIDAFAKVQSASSTANYLRFSEMYNTAIYHMADFTQKLCFVLVC